jgi:uncharacterized protein YaaR (DUF327 family)
MENEMKQMQEIIQMAGELDPDEMTVSDILAYIGAVNEFAEKLKPLVMKYTMKGGTGKSSFLFKL